MAKDLPYFKFYVSEYNDGDIRLCSMEAQGLFINLCALFWSREGNLTLSKAKKKWPDTRPELWQELISEKIIKVRNDRLKINFLNEQLTEREKIRIRNAENGKNGGRPKTQKEPKGNPLGYFQEPKVKPIREEERREEQEREKKQTAFGPTHSHFVVVKSKYLHEATARINGKAGLIEYMEHNQTVLNLPEHADKFMRANNGKVFNELSHLQNAYSLYIEKQYK